MQLCIPSSERYPVIEAQRRALVAHTNYVVFVGVVCWGIWPEEPIIVIVQHTPLLVQATIVKETPFYGGIMSYIIAGNTALQLKNTKTIVCC